MAPWDWLIKGVKSIKKIAQHLCGSPFYENFVSWLEKQHIIRLEWFDSAMIDILGYNDKFVIFHNWPPIRVWKCALTNTMKKYNSSDSQKQKFCHLSNFKRCHSFFPKNIFLQNPANWSCPKFAHLLLSKKLRKKVLTITIKKLCVVLINILSNAEATKTTFIFKRQNLFASLQTLSYFIFKSKIAWLFSFFLN